MLKMNLLQDIWSKNPLRSSKYKKYFDVYQKLFSKYRNTDITFVEIGVSHGGSLHMWKDYFTKNSRIIGIELDPNAKKIETDRIEIFIGDQSDENFWEDFFKKVGKVDVILDDGGHTNLCQIITSKCCIPNIKDNGMLVIEDVHTNYMKSYFNPSDYSFINFSKKLVDDVNFTHPNIGEFKYSLNKFIYSIEYFANFVAFKIDTSRTYHEKGLIKKNGLLSDIESQTYHVKLKFFDTSEIFRKCVKILKKIKIIMKIGLFIKLYLQKKKEGSKVRKYFK